TDASWMLLFINADSDPATGWQGYDFRVNRTVRSRTESLLEKAGAGGKWEPAGPIEYRLRGRELELAVPREALDLSPEVPVWLNFKWADNIQKDNDVMEFTINGDAAPNA